MNSGSEQIKVKTARVRRVGSPPELAGPQDSVWRSADVLVIDQFRPEGSDHRPQTSLRLLHDNRAIYGLFQVQDRYVRCAYAKIGEPVYRDSCVEFFARPKPGCGYFNFEFNCGGNLLCCYITDETRVQGAFKEFVRLSADDLAGVQVSGSMPKIVEPEIAEPVDWWLAFAIPVAVMEKFVGPVGRLSGQAWTGNAYKCGNDTSHPHWAAWSPVDQLNFHLPRCFGEFIFD